MERLIDKVGAPMSFPKERQNEAVMVSGRTVGDVHFDNITEAAIVRFYSEDFDTFGYNRPK
jgi:hypothetical protein